MLKTLLALGSLVVGGGAFVWLLQRRQDDLGRMAGRLGLTQVSGDTTEETADAARELPRRWQRLLMRGQLDDRPATVWQRFWYENRLDSRPYMRASFCVLALERTMPAPFQAVIEPADLGQFALTLTSRWVTAPTGAGIDARWRVTSDAPQTLELLFTPALAESLGNFADRFACDDPFRYTPDMRPAVLGWFDLEPMRVTYTTLGQPDEACAERMLCALPVLTALARL